MPYYAVGYSRSGGTGYDIGEFDNFSAALLAAQDAGAVVPAGVVDAAEIVFQVSQTETIWIQRFDDPDKWYNPEISQDP